MHMLDLKLLLEDLEENAAYEEYLTKHIENVQKGYEWFKDNLPDLLSEDNYIEESAYYGELEDIIAHHDKTKRNRIPNAEQYYELTCEYDAYAQYFYGDKHDKEEFNRAWLSHIHHNPHHWQHWVLVNDDDGTHALDMPYVFIIEMILDWWSFSWKNNNLYEVFEWYANHEDNMILSDKTRKIVNNILEQLKKKLGEN